MRQTVPIRLVVQWLMDSVAILLQVAKASAEGPTDKEKVVKLLDRQLAQYKLLTYE